jgi:RHS repeat-associated protein
LYSADKAIEIVKTGNITKIITYITGDPYSANYMKIETLNGGSLVSNYKYYLHRDNQQTIVAITEANGGAVVEKRYFDAWGNLKAAIIGANTTQTLPNAMGWVQNLLIDRGYTGHEHLTSIGLIHMNGRIYDPQLRRFLSPDNYVQDTENTQNYNRFGYVYNNPLLYTDPSGEFILEAIIIAVLINSINNVIMACRFGMGWARQLFLEQLQVQLAWELGMPKQVFFKPQKCLLFQPKKRFLQHQAIATELAIAYYFANPYCSWERGANENLNGLIREYFSKGSSVENITKEQVQIIENKPSNRPRKRFGFKTPNQVYLQKLTNNGTVAFIT